MASSSSSSSVLGKCKFPNGNDDDDKQRTQSKEKETDEDDSAPILLPLYETKDELFRRRWVDRLYGVFQLIGKDPCRIIVDYLQHLINRIVRHAQTPYQLTDGNTAAVIDFSQTAQWRASRFYRLAEFLDFRGLHPLSVSSARCTITVTCNPKLLVYQPSYLIFGIRECSTLDSVYHRQISNINTIQSEKEKEDLESSVLVYIDVSLKPKEQGLYGRYTPNELDGHFRAESENRSILNCKALSPVFDGVPITMEVDMTSLTFTWSIKGAVVATIKALSRRSSKRSDRRPMRAQLLKWINNGRLYVECHPPANKISVVTDEAATLSM